MIWMIWGYHHFRTPPYVYTVYINVCKRWNIGYSLGCCIVLNNHHVEITNHIAIFGKDVCYNRHTVEHWNTQHLYTNNLLKKPWSCMDVLGISWIFHIYIASQQDSCWQRRNTWLCCLWLSRPFLRSALSVGLAGCAWCHQTKMDLFIPTETGMSIQWFQKKRSRDFNGFNQQW